MHYLARIHYHFNLLISSVCTSSVRRVSGRERSNLSCFVSLIYRFNSSERVMLCVFRRMFPIPDFCLAGLEPDQYYGCTVEVLAVDSSRYRHKSDQGWVPASKGIQLDQTHNKYLHPNSASLGQYWMVQGAMFDKLKLSNHILPDSDNVSDL